jgi:hypothetical protein
MDVLANELIDALGGTTAVASVAKTGVSTVHHWRKTGLPPSRLDHLFRIAQDDYPSVDIHAIARRHGVDVPSPAEAAVASSGNRADVSAEALS